MSDADVTRLLGDLTRELQQLQRELGDGRRGGLSFGQLSRFTSEVAIPGAILVLETNIRALELLRRAIRLAEGREPRESGGAELRDRAQQLGETTLARLDDALAQVQGSLAEDDEDAKRLLDEARRLQSQIEKQLDTGESTATDGTESVDIDVESELRTLKDNLEKGGDGRGGNDDRGESGDRRDDDRRGDRGENDDQRGENGGENGNRRGGDDP